RDVDRRRAHAFPARAGLRGPGPPAEPDAALLASRARRAGLDLAESPGRGRACRRHRRPRAGLTGAVRRAAIPIVLLLGWVLAVRAAADLRLDAESQVGNAVD